MTAQDCKALRCHPERSLAESKDLGPTKPGHACPEHNRRGSDRWFALLCMTIMLSGWSLQRHTP